jgi:hypothetical protein
LLVAKHLQCLAYAGRGARKQRQDRRDERSCTSLGHRTELGMLLFGDAGLVYCFAVN